MTIQPGAMVYTQGFASRPENVEVPHIDVRAPTTTDILYPIGKRWIDTVGNAQYILTSQSAVANVTSALWVASGGGTIELSTLTGDSGTATPSGGNIKIAGTANQITTAASGSTVTLSLPAAITTPGSLTTTTTLASGTTVVAGTTVTGGTGVIATTGNVTATNGNLVLGTAGNKIVSTSVASTTTAGANSFGTVTLGSGTATIATTAVTASSIIMLTRQSPGSTGANPLGMLSVGTITASTSFVINALTTANSTTNVTTDVSVIGWMIIN
jgi:hypothetical protein